VSSWIEIHFLQEVSDLNGIYCLGWNDYSGRIRAIRIESLKIADDIRQKLSNMN
jgi:hypothetical protein